MTTKFLDLMMAHRDLRIVYNAAKALDDAEASRVADCYCDAWESGKSFLNPFAGFQGILGNPPMRDGDTTEELDSCMNELRSVLEGVVYNAWIKQMTREETVALCNLMLRAPFGGHAFFQVVTGVRLDNERLLAAQWNKAHPDEAEITPPAQDYII